MQREIKFRAWDTIRKCFVNNSEFAGMVNPTDGGNKTVQLRYADAVILMQYTGLKDKHGKEIYEGDIVRHLPTAFNSSSGVGEIYYHKGHARFALKWVGNLEHYLDSLNSYEIIGNVYENPDLLSTQPSQGGVM